MAVENIPSIRGEIKVLRTENKIFRSLHDHHLTEDDLRKAALELGETEQLKITSLQKLRKKLEDHKNPFNRCDDAFLLRYLRYTKFNPDKAYKSLEKLHNFRKDKPDLFELPDNINELIDSGLVRILPYRDREDSVIFYIDIAPPSRQSLLTTSSLKSQQGGFAPGKWNVEEMTIVNIAQLTTVIADLSTMNPSCQVHSVVGIWDVAGFSMQHFQKLSPPRTLILLLSLLLECYPWRIKNLYVVNCGNFVRKALNGIVYLIKKKIAERIVVLGSDPSELLQFLDKDVLPKENGGTIEESDTKSTKFVMENLEYLKYHRSFTQP